jgi:hypothetical protein
MRRRTYLLFASAALFPGRPGDVEVGGQKLLESREVRDERLQLW